MNYYWNKWVEVLPFWMAPNLVTTTGGMFCLSAFLLTWYYNPLFSANATPYWVLIVNGFCTWAYYTLDCMDGKQARRTGTSSPLGQLFDHGCDCVCNIAHISSVMAVLNLGPTTIAIGGQVILQFSFFTAQWQEYHTHELPHKFGELGVTEVNHGTALFSLVFGVLQGLGVVDPSEFFNSPSPVAGLKNNELFIWGWIAMNVVLLTISLTKTVKAAGLASLGHLVSPFIAAFSSMLLATSSPTILTSNLRLVMLSVGFLFSQITNKMIVFSMAQMTFATLQFDVIPLALVAVGLPNMPSEQGEAALRALCAWQGARMVYWSKKTIAQLCEKLDINCFTIKEKTE
jgi:ethanolaminephosphotransferase